MNTDAKTADKRVHEERTIIPLIPCPYRTQEPKAGGLGTGLGNRGMRVVSHSLYRVLLENQRLNYDQVTHARR